MDRQCSSCGGFCKKSGCERENVKPKEKRQWVGLTDDDYEELLRTRDWGVYLIEAVEAKLKEKNNDRR